MRYHEDIGVHRLTSKHRDIQQQRRVLLHMMLRDNEGILYILTIILFNWFTMGITSNIMGIPTLEDESP